MGRSLGLDLVKVNKDSNENQSILSCVRVFFRIKVHF